MVKKTNPIKEYTKICASKNEAECEEDLDEIGLKKEEVEGEFFDDDSEFEE